MGSVKKNIFNKRNYFLEACNEVVDRSLFKRFTRSNFIVFAVWFSLMTIIIAVPFFSNKVNFKIGDIAPFSVFSPVDTEFSTRQDIFETERLREERAAQVEKVYDIDNEAIEIAKEKVALFFRSINKLKERDLSDEQRFAIKEKLIFDLPQKNLSTIINTDTSVLVLVESLIVQQLEQIMAGGVEDKNSLDLRVAINNEVSRMNLQIRHKEIIKEILLQAVENNKTFNLIATNLKKSQVRASVLPRKTRLVKNQPIIYVGDKVTEQHIEILKKLGLHGSLFNPLKILAVAILNFISLFLLAGYLGKNKPAVLKNNKELILIVSLSLVILMLARFFVNLEPLYLPLIAIAFLFTITLHDITLTAILLFLLSFQITLIFKYDFYYFSILLINALLAIYFSRMIVERNDITKAGFWTAVFSVLVFWAVSAAMGRLVLGSVLVLSLKLALVSLFSSMLVQGILPYIEDFFGVVTSIKLLELANPNNVLLKRLLIEAPGTYHHSIMVANLAEAAVEVTSGNPLLARVAAYYHDIGKVNRPYFFIENQTGLGNPHDNINISLSVLIILSHVKEGVEIARKHKIPNVIIDIIKQHHGTSVMSYFYRSFLESSEEKKDKLTDADFRYPGPKPQTKEAAAILLADSCEAAIRSLEKATPSKVQNMIEKIIKEKFNSGQLDECDLTFKDLHNIKNAFMRRLEGSFHSRIEYPDESPAAEPLK